MSVYPVLLAGGSGTRLWPVSRELCPKQLVSFMGEDSLIQSTIKRLSPVLDIQKVKIVCGSDHFSEIKRHMKAIGIDSNGNVIGEPCGRNTAPAILLALFDILRKESDAIVCIFPADHIINNVKNFHGKLESAIRLAAEDYIVTFGIRPGYPETGYGYIEGQNLLSEGAFSIKRFVEKPDLQAATHYVKAGNFFWNSGMFAFKASVAINEFKAFQPDLYNRMKSFILKEGSPSYEDYKILPNISLDVAIMEKTLKGAVLPSDFGWSDIGSWKSLYDFLPKDKNQNVLQGDVIVNNTENCLVMGHERLIATNHIKNMVIVETHDSIFVSDIENSRDVKEIVGTLRGKDRWEYYQHSTVSKPWGSHTVLEVKDDYKISRIIVYSGSDVKIQNSEPVGSKTIVVAKGIARAMMESGSISLHPGHSFKILPGNEAVIENADSDPLVIIQIESVTLLTRVG